jgi:2-dehydropantoate 2-reductase
MRILCLGAGAVGGYFCGRLIEADAAEVTFLVRPERQARLRAEGLRIESAAYGNFSSKDVRTILQQDLASQTAFDVVILTCKAYDLDDAMASIAPAVDRGAAVLPLLNGLSHLEALNTRFGADRVLGGLAKIAATVTSDGTIRHLNDWRFLVFGEQGGALSPRVMALKQAFDRTSVVATAVPDVMSRMWEKLVHLATVASMTCLMRASVGEIARTPDGTTQMMAVLDCVAEIAARAGFPVTDAFKAEYRRLFHDRESNYTASMLRDLESGKQIEGDHIVGFARAKASEYQLEAPLLEAAYTHLKSYEARRAAGRL